MQGALDEQLQGEIKLDKVQPLEMIFERISVDANIEIEVPNGKGGYKKEPSVRNILKQCSGKFEPKTMTAILGPSGCGKTTMLNLLSGRLLSKNLTLNGIVRVNNKPVTTMNDYKSLIGYVMQEDLMLPTFTPKETFRFITDMRLPHKTSQEKDMLVANMIQSLGLKKCENTYVGNNMIRGVSGGEKKRTSVGVELLINPSMIFLDQPTTGLDSTTALNLIKFLNRLAEAGRTVITTIHQPSSQIFMEIDRIILMVDGNIIYQNNSKDSMAYFDKLNMPVPIHSNPIDHYMKLMNKEGIALQYIERGEEYNEEEVKQEFTKKVAILKESYEQSFVYPKNAYQNQLVDTDTQASWCTQFFLIIKRTILNELRNPLGIRAKVGQMIFFAIIAIILYEKQSSDLNSYIQNTRGVLFFLTMSVAFGAIFGSLNVFSQQRPVFIRERLSNTYSTTSYYIGRSLAYIPLEILLPFLLIIIQYFAVHLDSDADSFFATAGSCWLGFWMASAYGLFLSTAFADAEVALSLVPVLIIPLMLVGGFFAPLENVHDFFKVFQSISVFKYIYQTLVAAQFMDDTDGFTYKGDTYKGNILSDGGQFDFDEPMWLSYFLMGIIGLAIRILSMIALYIISNPKRLRLDPPKETSGGAEPANPKATGNMNNNNNNNK